MRHRTVLLAALAVVVLLAVGDDALEAAWRWIGGYNVWGPEQ